MARQNGPLSPFLPLARVGGRPAPSRAESTDRTLGAPDSSLDPAITYVILGELTSPHLAGPPVLTGTVTTGRYPGPWPVPTLNLDSARLSRKDPHVCSPLICPPGGGPPASGTLSQGLQAPVGVEGMPFRYRQFWEYPRLSAWEPSLPSRPAAPGGKPYPSTPNREKERRTSKRTQTPRKRQRRTTGEEGERRALALGLSHWDPLPSQMWPQRGALGLSRPSLPRSRGN